MALAIFDLDNTLLNGDSDHAWGEFLVERKIVDSEQFSAQNDAFYRDYQAGKLDINEYLTFALAPLSQFNRDQLTAWHKEFMASKVAPMLQEKAKKLVKKHRDDGDTLLIITATNRFVTEPIATLLGIDHLLASEAEIIDDRYTGKPTGIPCFQGGKVTRLHQWLESNQHTLQDSAFYSDSHNDLPLLELVDKPVAVDPDEQLTRVATERNWPIISLRD